jgi:hypothetical protein
MRLVLSRAWPTRPPRGEYITRPWQHDWFHRGCFMNRVGFSGRDLRWFLFQQRGEITMKYYWFHTIIYHKNHIIHTIFGARQLR